MRNILLILLSALGTAGGIFIMAAGKPEDRVMGLFTTLFFAGCTAVHVSTLYFTGRGETAVHTEIQHEGKSLRAVLLGPSRGKQVGALISLALVTVAAVGLAAFPDQVPDPPLHMGPVGVRVFGIVLAALCGAGTVFLARGKTRLGIALTPDAVLFLGRHRREIPWGCIAEVAVIYYGLTPASKQHFLAFRLTPEAAASIPEGLEQLVAQTRALVGDWDAIYPTEPLAASSQQVGEIVSHYFENPAERQRIGLSEDDWVE